MDRQKLIDAISLKRIEWSAHALRRMLERGISRKSVKQTIIAGELIENYPDDTPFPSALFFEMCQKAPLHVIISYDNQNKMIFVITAYRPDKDHFEADFKTRRK